MTKFNPLNYPIALTEPARIAPSGWLLHVPFAMYLIDVIRPKLLVELGSHFGVSYCAFCQAIKALGTGTQAYAVDTWEGDDQAGFYGPEVLENLRQHHDPLYSGFSHLLQTTFSQAAHQFSDGSIDFLHIDGCHNYEAVYQDWTEWRSKLSDCGIVLFHDTHVRFGDFGVWKLWEELQGQYPSFDIPYGYGLGVVAVGPDIPPALRELIELPDDEKQTVIEYFHQLGKRISAAEDRRILIESHGYEIRGFQEQISGYQNYQNTLSEQYRLELMNVTQQHENALNAVAQTMRSQYENEVNVLQANQTTELEVMRQQAELKRRFRCRKETCLRHFRSSPDNLGIANTVEFDDFVAHGVDSRTCADSGGKPRHLVIAAVRCVSCQPAPLVPVRVDTRRRITFEFFSDAINLTN